MCTVCAAAGWSRVDPGGLAPAARLRPVRLIIPRASIDRVLVVRMHGPWWAVRKPQTRKPPVLPLCIFVSGQGRRRGKNETYRPGGSTDSLALLATSSARISSHARCKKKNL